MGECLIIDRWVIDEHLITKYSCMPLSTIQSIQDADQEYENDTIPQTQIDNMIDDDHDDIKFTALWHHTPEGINLILNNPGG